MAKVAKIDEGSDFVLRAMNALVDAQNRQLETIDVAEVKKTLQNLDTMTKEAAAVDELKNAERQEYNNLMNEIKGYITFLEAVQVELPLEIRMEIENIERKQKAEEVKKAKAEEAREEYEVEPE